MIRSFTSIRNKDMRQFCNLLSSSFVSTRLLGTHGINYRIQLPLLQSRINDTQQDLGLAGDVAIVNLLMAK